MRNDELKEYLDEKRRQGLDEIGCWQVYNCNNSSKTDFCGSCFNVT